jgi:uncharacterized membrane protein
MIEQHVGIWLWRGPGPGETWFDHQAFMAFNGAASIGLPLFLGLAGVGTTLLLHKHPRDGARMAVARGVGLLVLAYLLNLTTSWFSWGSWFAVHLIGFGVLLGPLWGRLSTRALLGVAVGILVATPLLQMALHSPEQFDNPRMRDVTMTGGALRLAVAEGQYPIIPWLSVFVAGCVVGRWILADRLRPMVMLPAIALVIGGVGHGLQRLWGDGAPELFDRAFRLVLGFFPASIAMVCIIFGLGFLLVAAAESVLRRRPPLRSSNPLVTLGRTSLTLFFVHIWLFRELSRPLGLWSELSPAMCLVYIFGFTAFWIAFTRWWARYDYRFGAEWLLRVIADPIARQRQ